MAAWQSQYDKIKRRTLLASNDIPNEVPLNFAMQENRNSEKDIGLRTGQAVDNPVNTTMAIGGVDPNAVACSMIV